MILVVGKGSFLAKTFLKSLESTPHRAISHFEVDRVDIYGGVKCIVNFAFAPELYVEPYAERYDVDILLARQAAARKIHYVMLSSRKVYQSAIQWGAQEDLHVTGRDAYGINKICVESKLMGLLGNRLTILRPGNIVGYEVVRDRTSFGSYLLQQLATSGGIRLTINPRVRRNILSVESFCEILAVVVVRRPVGIFNIGSTEAVEVGRVASWIIDGFGSGNLVCEGDQVDDEFHLNVDRLTSTIGLKYDATVLEDYAKSLGRRLKIDIEQRIGF